MKIALSRLSVKSLAWLAGAAIDESTNEKYAVVKDHPLVMTLKAEYESYFEVFDKKAYSGKGKLVKKADIRRNKAFIGMKFCVYGLTLVDENSQQQDAVDVYRVFKQFGLDLNRKTYMTKTAVLTKLVEELSVPENLQKIERLHLIEILEILSAAQIDFENKVSEQATANAQLRGMESASSLRGNLEMALDNYFKVVTAMKEIDGWEHLYAILEEFAKSASNSRRKKKDSDPTANDPTTEPITTPEEE